MISKSSLLKPLAIAALVAAGGAANATITIYTTLASFTAAVGTTGTDTYTGFSIVTTTASPIIRSAGSFGYTAAVDTTSFFGAGTAGDPWLSTNTATDGITFNAFTGGVVAAGGNFFGSDINGAFAAGDVTLSATDANGTVSQTITGAATSSFLGFVSNGPLLSMRLVSVQPAAGFLWPTADNLVLAAAAAVPEPQTYALMLAGLGVLGFRARRRQA